MNNFLGVSVKEINTKYIRRPDIVMAICEDKRLVNNKCLFG